MILEQIKGPEDLKKLTSEELSQLAEEIRAFLIEKISHTGGHLASNLGVVELTIALFRTFDLPEDKIIWDVGHQSYTHKILSGRRMEFDELRQYGGLSGFPICCVGPGLFCLPDVPLQTFFLGLLLFCFWQSL